MMGKYLLSVLILVSALSTAYFDLSYLHSANEAWPPHARLHGIWGVTHVFGTHALALVLLWVGSAHSYLVRLRVSVLILLAYVLSFFMAALLMPLFGGALAPDVAPDVMPPEPFGIDGNLFSFVVGTPLILYAWWLCEKEHAGNT